MIQSARMRPIRVVLLFYLLCFVLRGIEYLAIRTDQTIIGEAFLHKLAGIALLAAAVWSLKFAWADIGFRSKQAVRDTLLGFLLGGSVFFVAYGTEWLIHALSGNSPSLRFFVTSYAIQGNQGMQDGLMFVLLCITGNIVNVVMEEGVFRGLFPRLMEEKHSFLKACLISSILFGIWHIAQPVRNVLDGEQSVMGALMSGVLLVTTSIMLAIQFCMLFKVTGSIWAGMAMHFVNNASINLLHVSTATGVDKLQTVRIAIAQTISFIIILALFVIHRKKREKASRAFA